MSVAGGAAGAAAGAETGKVSHATDLLQASLCARRNPGKQGSQAHVHISTFQAGNHGCSPGVRAHTCMHTPRTRVQLFTHTSTLTHSAAHTNDSNATSSAHLRPQRMQHCQQRRAAHSRALCAGEHARRAACQVAWPTLTAARLHATHRGGTGSRGSSGRGGSGGRRGCNAGRRGRGSGRRVVWPSRRAAGWRRGG